MIVTGLSQAEGETLLGNLITNTTKQGIEAASKALDLYESVVDEVLDWKRLEVFTEELNIYQDDLSYESRNFLDEFKVLFKDGMKSHNSSGQHINEWVDLALPFLRTFIGLLKKHDTTKVKVPKIILLRMLDEQIAKMKVAQNDLHSCSASFKQASEKLTSLEARLTIEFDVNNQFFQNKLNEVNQNWLDSKLFGPFKVHLVGKTYFAPELKSHMNSYLQIIENWKLYMGRSSEDIETTIKMLEEQIQNIKDVKEKLKGEETNTDTVLDSNLRVSTIEFAEKLIDKCTVFQNNHIK